MTRDEFLSRWALEADGVGSAFRVDVDALLAAERAEGFRAGMKRAASAIDYGEGRRYAERIREALAEEARRG